MNIYVFKGSKHTPIIFHYEQIVDFVSEFVFSDNFPDGFFYLRGVRGVRLKPVDSLVTGYFTPAVCGSDSSETMVDILKTCKAHLKNSDVLYIYDFYDIPFCVSTELLEGLKL